MLKLYTHWESIQITSMKDKIHNDFFNTTTIFKFVRIDWLATARQVSSWQKILPYQTSTLQHVSRYSTTPRNYYFDLSLLQTVTFQTRDVTQMFANRLKRYVPRDQRALWWTDQKSPNWQSFTLLTTSQHPIRHVTFFLLIKHGLRDHYYNHQVHNDDPEDSKVSQKMSW